MTKKIVLLMSGIFGFVFVLNSFLLLNGLFAEYRPVLKALHSVIVFFSLPLPIIFILSLITYKLRTEAFYAWWNFARWFVPIIILVTYLQNTGTRTGGMGIAGAVGDSFNWFVLGILYIILIAVSGWRIWRVYKR